MVTPRSIFRKPALYSLISLFLAGWATSQEFLIDKKSIRAGVVADMLEAIATNHLNIHTMIVAKKGKTVLSFSRPPFSIDTPQEIYSATKTITTLLVAAEIERSHRFDESARLLDFFNTNDLSVDPRRQKITLRDLMQMQSGIRWNDWDTGFKSELDMHASSNWTRYVLNLPTDEEPGTRFNYAGGNNLLLSAAIGNTSVENGKSKVAQASIFGALGITNYYWQKTPEGVLRGWGFLVMAPRDLLKIGELCLQNGNWKGRKLLPSDWMKKTLENRVKTQERKSLTMLSNYAYSWWFPNFGGLAAWGAGGQVLYLDPPTQTAIVVTGWFDHDTRSFELIRDYVLKALEEGKPGSGKSPRKHGRAANEVSDQPDISLLIDHGKLNDFQPGEYAFQEAVNGSNRFTFKVEKDWIDFQWTALSNGVHVPRFTGTAGIGKFHFEDSQEVMYPDMKTKRAGRAYSSGDGQWELDFENMWESFQDRIFLRRTKEGSNEIEWIRNHWDYKKTHYTLVPKK